MGHLRGQRLALEQLEPRLVLQAGPFVISEFLAANDAGLVLDGDADTSDWIEIYNRDSTPQSLDGWYLTDDADDLIKWQFPDITLQPGEYHMVFASGKNRTDPTGELHTNFQLDSDGEYLALVQPDRMTIGHEYASSFPSQVDDISYGIPQESIVLASGDNLVAHQVPTDGAEASTWMLPEFEDSTWQDKGREPTILITEANTSATDYVEIQNVSDQTVVTDGWAVVLNKGTTLNINQYHTVLWYLPESMAPGEILHKDDNSSGEYYIGEGIGWSTGGRGWAMILDGDSAIADLAVWSYPATDIAGMAPVIGGSPVRGASAWTGAGVATNYQSTLVRIGTADHDQASDFVFVSESLANRGETNPDLTLPVAEGRIVGVGYDAESIGFKNTLQTDVLGAMKGNNASLWTRFEFDLDDPQDLDSMFLRMQYNDGFVAYLNGIPIASRNAPASVQWNSTATAERTIQESLQWEEFKLSSHMGDLVPGTNVLAIHALNSTANDSNLLIVPELVGIVTGTTPQFYFDEPTPGGLNGEGFLGYVKDTNFSVDRGFFDAPFSLEITTNTPDATIYYTTDGSVPSATNGQIYTGPITIDETTVMRAVAVKEGYRHKDIDTMTYVFLDDVIVQDGAGLPDVWGKYIYTNPGQNRPANYEMDPNVVNDPRYKNTIKDDLRAIPTMSLVLDPDDLWDQSTGIYSNSTMTGDAWERATSVELIDVDGSTQFQIDAGLRIHGGWGRRPWQNSKHSFRLLFRGEYGATKLDYPLFGDEATNKFDTLVLRAGFNDSWTGGNPSTTYLQDPWSARTQNDMGGYGPHGTFVHLYVNGLYWGLYNPVERPNADFAAAYFGGEDEDYDAIVTRKFIDGNTTAWNQLLTTVRATTIDYDAVKDQLDLDTFMNYLILNHFGANWDWPQNNWYATHGNLPGGKWQFHSWDGEGNLDRDVYQNRVSNYGNNGPGEIYQNLRNLPEFRREFADRVHRHLFNDGLLTTAANVERWDKLTAQIDRAIVGESARWGDGGRNQAGTAATRDLSWAPAVQSIRNSYFAARPAILIGQY
ncbi:MAG TPA: CotH kinase family protein, partial [Thermoguttaceae bacterium]|nr:CotH kinase family protein [Thermoguttaceae bacterium]